MKTATTIRQRIEGMPLGETFLVSQFLSVGSRSSVDQAICRLAKAGVITRVARGVYVRPKPSRLFGTALPSTEQIVQTVAAAHGEIVEISGVEAERRFGFTTQTAMKTVYLTSGPTRRIRIGKLEIELRHTCARKLALAGTKEGQALLALLSRGKNNVGEREVERVQRQLSSEEFNNLASAFEVIPGWLASALNKRVIQHV